MNEQEIKKAIETARSAVSDISDEKLRDKTYEIVLNNLLARHSEASARKSTSSSSSPLQAAGKDDTIPKASLRSTKKASEELGVDESDLVDYLDVENDHVELLHNIDLKNNYQEHICFAIVTLTLKKAFDESNEVIGLDIIKSVRQRGIANPQSFSNNVQKYPEFILVKAREGRAGNTYRITSKGYSAGKDFIRAILSGTSAQEAYDTIIEPKKKKSVASAKNTVTKTKSGMSAEVRNMLSQGFFDSFKTVTELQAELKSKGFFTRRQDIDAFVRKQLMKAENVLYREKKDGTWQYVKRK